MAQYLHWILDRAARWMVSHPRWSILLVLVYFFCPVDVLPEALVGPLGYLDDFLVMLLPLVARAYIGRHPKAPKPIDTTAE